MIQTFGPHRIRHGDVNDLAGIAELMGTDKADFMYSDPPWGEGNIKYWATMNQKMTGAVVQPAPLDRFLSSVFTIASTYVTRYLLIEYGQQWADMIQVRGKAAGFVAHGIVKIKYAGGSGPNRLLPLDLHVFARPGETIPAGYAKAVEGSHGYDGVKRAFMPIAAHCKAPNHKPIVIDPCCGMGYTAQACIDTGLAFRGNELNQKRLGKTIARLQKATLR